MLFLYIHKYVRYGEGVNYSCVCIDIKDREKAHLRGQRNKNNLPEQRSGQVYRGAGVEFESPGRKYSRLGCALKRTPNTPYFLPCRAPFSSHCEQSHSKPPASSVGSGFKLTQQKEKTNHKGWFLFLVAGVGFEPHDLRVMSPTSYQAALPRDIMQQVVPGTGIEPVRYFRTTGF